MPSRAKLLSRQHKEAACLQVTSQITLHKLRRRCCTCGGCRVCAWAPENVRLYLKRGTPSNVLLASRQDVSCRLLVQQPESGRAGYDKRGRRVHVLGDNLARGGKSVLARSEFALEFVLRSRNSGKNVTCRAKSTSSFRDCPASNGFSANEDRPGSTWAFFVGRNRLCEAFSQSARRPPPLQGVAPKQDKYTRGG